MQTDVDKSIVSVTRYGFPERIAFQAHFSKVQITKSKSQGEKIASLNRRDKKPFEARRVTLISRKLTLKF